jgi:hypothetical protein
MTDSQSALSPEVFERIVRAVMERIRETQGRERRAESERRVRPGVSMSEASSWE